MSWSITLRWILGPPLAWLVLVVWLASAAEAGTINQPTQQLESQARIGHLVKVNLPIDDLVSRNVRQTLKQLADAAPPAVRPENRPVVVLELDTSAGQTGRGSELEACQALARLLTSSELNAIETVSYVPAPNLLAALEDGQENVLAGHAVLVAIATNQLALSPEVAMGQAGADESTIDPLVRTVYRSIAEKGLTLPVPVVMAMLDDGQTLYRAVREGQGAADYVNAEQLAVLESQGSVDSQTLTRPNEPFFMTAQQMEGFPRAKQSPSSRVELARLLRVDKSMLETDSSLEGNREAVEVSLPYLVDEQAESWLLSTLNQEIAGGANLLIIVIDESTGDPSICLSLARRLGELREQDVQTVAFVRGQARQGAAVVALACQQLIMAPDAVLGGFSEEQTPLEPPQIEALQAQLIDLGQICERDWSLLKAMLDPGLPLTQYVDRGSREMRFLSNGQAESLENLDELAPLGPLNMTSGLKANTAESLRIARLVAEDMGQVQTFYQLDEAPRRVELTSQYRTVRRFARFLTNPFVGVMLLMAGFFFLSTEMSAPGLSVPGLLSAVCFGLYFWSHVLDGNAIWLEIMMFGLGIVCLFVELLVLPGFGVFGIGGIILILLSLVLAAQDFVIPTSTRQIEQLPGSLMPVVGGAMGVLLAAVVLRNALPNSKYLRQFMLQTGDRREETGLERSSDPEAIVDWSFLVDQSGKTVTRLNPAGKARINGEIYNVISTGQMIGKSQEIIVVEALGNRVVVQAKHEGKG